MHITLISAILALCLTSFTAAQQFAGSVINTTLPSVYGSEIAYFNILDANKKNTTLINYSSFNSQGQRLTPSNVKRAVIFIHGELRDPYLYMQDILTAFGTNNRSDVTLDNVQMVTPYFTNGDDKGIWPWNASATHGSTTNVLVWQGSGWINGSNNEYPWNKQSISSYAALDQMVQYFDNKTLFPNMQQIVVGGHSAGGQTIQRYAMVGNVLNITTPLTYYVANPNSYAWLSADRPLDTSSCPIYDDWKEGLTNYTNTYGASLVASGRAAVLANYASRTINYGRGLLDVYDDSSTCAPFTTGINRNERFFNFIKEFPISYPSTIDYVDVGHDAYGMMSSVAGMNRLFYDNFDGQGEKLYDYGCPRQQAGDDPFPDPTCNITKPIADAGVFSGWQYEGCFTDLYNSRSLPNWLWSSDNTTIESCTQACGGLGYTIAGLEYGNECFCGNALASQIFGPLVEASCTMSCAGNSSQICGDSDRLSLFTLNSTLISNSSTSSNSTLSSSSFTTSAMTSTVAAVTTSSSTTASPSSTISPSCPSSDGSVYTTSGTSFEIQCYNDSMYSDIGGSARTLTSLPDCIAACSTTTGCVDVSFIPTKSQCWLKSSLNSGTYNTLVWGARLLSGSASSSTSGITPSVTSATSSVTPIASTATSISVTTTSSGTSVTSSSTPSATTTTGLPAGFAALGCYIDSTNRVLPYLAYQNSSNTPYICASACSQLGYAYAGGEYANQCWCGGSLISTLRTSDSDCNWGCWGDNSQACGGPWRLSVWGPAS